MNGIFRWIAGGLAGALLLGASAYAGSVTSRVANLEANQLGIYSKLGSIEAKLDILLRRGPK